MRFLTTGSPYRGGNPPSARNPRASQQAVSRVSKTANPACSRGFWDESGTVSKPSAESASPDWSQSARVSKPSGAPSGQATRHARAGKFQAGGAR